MLLLPARCVWAVLLLLGPAAGDLEISQLLSDQPLTCSEVLSDCSVSDDWPLGLQDEDTVHVHSLKAYFKICCESRSQCALCLGVDVEVNVTLLGEEREEEESEGEEEIPEVESVKVCYYAVNYMTACTRVEFAVNPRTRTQQQPAKISLVIVKPSGVSFGSQVVVFTHAASRLRQDVTAPSLEEVCSQAVEEHVQECRVPRLSSHINSELNRVELRPAEPDLDHLSVCVQYERNGECQKWNETSIPLYSVTPCTCFQAWMENTQRSTRSRSCPFERAEPQVQNNVWENISVSLAKGKPNYFGSMLWWNLSAPCRLSGEVWLCGQGVKQQLSNGTWRQNNNGLWERLGVFEDTDPERPPCVMVKVEGMTEELGPFYLKNTNRGPWGLLLACLMLLACLTALILHLLPGSVKKWTWSFRHRGFAKTGGKSLVVLVSPPEVDEVVAESLSQVGSLLAGHGLDVRMDQWSREQQSIMGPVPWLHSQLLELKQQRGGRVVLVLTCKALDAAEEWIRSEAGGTKVGDEGVTRMESPHCDLFVACLRLIHGAKQAGRAGEVFVLMTFDSRVWKDVRLPELFQGLPWFHVPSQTQALLTGLTVDRPATSCGRRGN